MMVVLGTDAHKRSHTVVATDETGRQVGEVTVAATSEGHLRLVKWSAQWPVRRWAIEDCRALSRRLEADLLRDRGTRRASPSQVDGRVCVVRHVLVASLIRLMHWRWLGPALREPDLLVARLDGPSREVRLLVDYRESLVRDRTAAQNRLRWRLHELVPGYDPPAGSLNRYKTLAAIDELLDNHTGVVVGCGAT